MTLPRGLLEADDVSNVFLDEFFRIVQSRPMWIGGPCHIRRQLYPNV